MKISNSDLNKPILDKDNLSVFIIGTSNNFRGQKLLIDISEMNFYVKRIEGIDATKITNEQLFSFSNLDMALPILKRNMSRGEACCAKAHLDAYTNFIESNNNWALILEDDAILNPKYDIRELLLLVNKLQSPSIVQLSPRTGYESFSKLFKFEILGKDSSNIGITKKLLPTHNADAYFINRSAAHLAITESAKSKIHYTADWPYIWDYKINFWHSTVPFFFQEGFSLLDKDRKKLIPPRYSKNRTLSRRLVEGLIDFSGIKAFQLLACGANVKTYYRSRVFSKLLYRFNLLKEIIQILLE